MGMILVFLFLAGVGIGVGALSLGIAACVQGAKKPHFLWPCVGATAVSAFLQYAVAMDFFQAPVNDWAHMVLGPMVGWHLLPPFILAALLAIPARRSTQGLLMGVAAGLLFSVTTVIVLAWPLALLRTQGSLPMLLN